MTTNLFDAFLSVEDSDNIVIVADREYPHLSFDALARITLSHEMSPGLATQWAAKLRMLADALENGTQPQICFLTTGTEEA